MTGIVDDMVALRATMTPEEIEDMDLRAQGAKPSRDRVTIGRMTVTFDPALPEAKRQALLKDIEAVSKQQRRKGPTMPRLTRLKVPTKGMLEAAATIVPEDGWMHRGTPRAVRYAAPGRPLLVMPEDALRAGILKQAEREVRLWEKQEPDNYRRWMRNIEEGRLERMPTEDIERVLASIIRPGGRVSGKFAASVVYGLAELERRREEAEA